MKDYPRLRGATRNGSKMELTMELQFLCFLSSKLVEGESAEKSINSANLSTVGEFVTHTFKEFIDLPMINKIGYFFTSPSGPTILSCIFNDSLNLQEPGDIRLLYQKGS